MDAAVLRSQAKWPDTPAAYGWLRLDRRGNWLLKEPDTTRFERIGNAALREFIGRNYEADERGRWFFQNGPQRVYVSLDYAPLVLHYEGEALFDHCGRPARAGASYIDEEGSILMRVERGLGLLDDRELAQFSARLGARWRALRKVPKDEVAARFSFVSDPRDSLR